MTYKSKTSDNKFNDTILEVSWDAIEHNIMFFKKQLKPNTKIMLMVKAAAYGHKTEQIVRKVEEKKLADYFGVATVFEGAELRKEGITLPILVQNVNHQEWETLIEHCLEPVLHNFEGINSFQKFLTAKSKTDNKSYTVHLELNTGMNRFGFDEAEINDLMEVLAQPRNWTVKSVMSHLSSANEPKAKKYTLDQLTKFKSIVEQMKPYLPDAFLAHTLNSGGIKNYVQHQHDMVRLGIGFYGALRSSTYQKKLKTVTRFVSKVAAVRKVNKGDKIGYNRAGKVEKEGWVAVLSLGYADGFPRKLGNGSWEVEINGKLYPIIGNVCMDSCMVFLGNDKVKVGDEVVMFGGKKTIFQFADAQDTITYEALTSIGPRVRRVLR